MMTSKKITINDVAVAAGVSVSTVSLVLSGKGRISTATGERVNQTIERLGFVRNRQASVLRGGQSGVIGLIVRNLSSPFYAEQGLPRRLKLRGGWCFSCTVATAASNSSSALTPCWHRGWTASSSLAARG